MLRLARLEGEVLIKRHHRARFPHRKYCDIKRNSPFVKNKPGTQPTHTFPPLLVMAGLGPAIHEKQLVDPRAKPEDDGSKTE